MYLAKDQTISNRHKVRNLCPSIWLLMQIRLPQTVIKIGNKPKNLVLNNDVIGKLVELLILFLMN